jgi:hypothetical protein
VGRVFEQSARGLLACGDHFFLAVHRKLTPG